MNSYNVTVQFTPNEMGIKGLTITVEAENTELAILATGYTINPKLVKHTVDVIVSNPMSITLPL